MRPEKQNITREYLTRLNASPFFIVVNYQGLKVSHFAELRKRLRKSGAELHVVKNSIFRIAAKEAGVGDFNGALSTLGSAGACGSPCPSECGCYQNQCSAPWH